LDSPVEVDYFLLFAGLFSASFGFFSAPDCEASDSDFTLADGAGGGSGGDIFLKSSSH